MRRVMLSLNWSHAFERFSRLGLTWASNTTVILRGDNSEHNFGAAIRGVARPGDLAASAQSVPR
jgi:hypothetical protein